MLELIIGEISATDFIQAQLLQSVEILPRLAKLKISGELATDGLNCQLFVNDNLFIDGEIIEKEHIRTPKKIETVLTIADKSYFASKSDCTPLEFTSATVRQIASKLLEDYGLNVESSDNSIVSAWSCHPLDNIYENLDSLAEKLDLVLLSDGKNKIILKKEHKTNIKLPKDDAHKFIHKIESEARRVTVYSQEKGKHTLSHGKGRVSKNYLLPFGKEINLFLASKKRANSFYGQSIEITFDDDHFFDSDLGDILTIDGIPGEFFLFKKTFDFDDSIGYYTTLFLRGQ